MKGIEVLRIHYTADPAKADPRWVEHAKIDVPRDQWAREMDMDAAAGLGMAIYGREYKPEIHEKPLAIDPRLPMGHGWDFGAGWPATVWVQRTMLNGVRVLAEMYGQDIQLRPFVARVIGHEINLLGGPFHSRRDYCDPAGNQPKDDGMKSVEILREPGWSPQWRGSEYSERHNYVSRLLMSNQEDGEPEFLIDPIRCPKLVEAFRARYRRAKDGNPDRTERPQIDLMNALEYYLMGTKAPARRSTQVLPIINPISGYGSFPIPRGQLVTAQDPW